MLRLFVFVVFANCTIINAQTIEKYSIDSGGAIASAGGMELMYTLGETSIQELKVSGTSMSEGFINSNFKVLVLPQVFLQGPMLNPSTPGLMNDDLRSGNQLPTTSPYADVATVNASIFTVTGNNAIVDWVWLELRASNDTGELINGKSALLQRDGDIVDLDGVSNLKMQAAPTQHYVVVKHRNHLGVMTGNTVGLKETANTSIAYKQNALVTYGSNAQVQLANGSMALWAGITDTNKKIRFSGANNNANVIKDAVLAHPGNGFNSVTYGISGYLLFDCDLNGQGKFSGSGNDSNIIKDNVLSHPANGFNSPTFTINPTVPPKN
ncbi:hemagglutinin protein [Pontimicrobium sp. SW4]|uniref:Hemagglutinin protein n=1 Tax=Pontimicrobium sp. SW4 TaxID=3153519 RepID=A0AAU7BNF6_9FLAO